MIFTSLSFVAFFTVVYALYRGLPHRAQNVMLVLASYVFYAAWDWRFLSLLVGSTVVDFAVARYLGRTDDPAKRKRALLLSLAFNLGMLGFFKYFNFFAENLAVVFGWFGWRVDPVTLHVILPIGISFYTFMTISYVVDVYRREMTPTDNLIDFALFVAYFPHLVAGPILRASLLLPQIARPRVIVRAQVTEGLWLIGWGAFQKMFVADNLGRVADGVFAAPSGTLSAVDVLVGIYAFALQIYGDFAGYSNIARGLSKLMGIELNVNFRYPYFVASPQAFWRHWHISLSSWLRDYLYIPLGGNQGTRGRTYRNLLITMLLGGLWHGAAWTFVFWGAYQGLTLIAGRVIQEWARVRGWALGGGWSLSRIVLTLVMFHVTCVGWLIFRAHSLAQVRDLAVTLVRGWHVAPAAGAAALTLALIALPWLAVHAYQARHDSESAPLGLAMPVRYAIYGAVFYLVLLFGDFQGAQFIYFQF